MSKNIRNILKTMRLRQWPKNAFVFAALVFDRQLSDLQPVLITTLAFFLFCLASSLVYILNDLADIKTDRLHPSKQNRPLASGSLSKTTAIITAAVLGIIVIPISFLANIWLGVIISGYIILMLAYSLWLKHIPLLDVMIIAAGFVLRVAAGVVIIQTQLFSPWLFVTTTFLALFIGLGKRRAEVDLLEVNAGAHRRVLDGYTLELLDQLLTIVLSITLMTYCLYTFSATIAPNNYSMMLTIPFVIYGLFRYLYLIRVSHIGGAPEEIVLTDRPMQLSVLFWGLTVVIILYIL
jgi:4-hydroxybenzoate polyprenyltransferase